MFNPNNSCNTPWSPTIKLESLTSEKSGDLGLGKTN